MSRLPPKPPGSALAHVARFARNPLEFLLDMRDHGDVVWLSLPRGREIYFVQTPELIEEALITRHHDFIKDKYTRALSDSLGNGLLLSEGDVWKRQRRLMQPAFHHQRIASYGTTMVSEAKRSLAEWQDGQVRNVHADMMRLTSEIAALTLFGTHVGDDTAAVSRSIEHVMQRYLGFLGTGIPLPMWIPTPINRRFRRALTELDAILFRFIRERRESSAEHDDLLSLLLHARDAGGQRMTDQQLRDECVTLFVAGHETTALALSYTFFLLAQHPRAMRQLRREHDRVLGGRAPSTDDLSELRVTKAVIEESMRLYPAAWAIGREATVDTRIGDYVVPRGTELCLSQWAVHRDPRFFTEPARFVPERWRAPDTERHRFAYFPFGGGPRVCIGNAFAMTEAMLVLATMLPHFELELVGPPRLELLPSVTLRPRHGVHLRLHARRARAAA